ncbi:MAG: hypothetical protein ACREDG_01100 [Methylocella sp.]
MRRGWTAGVLAIVTAFALAPDAAAKAPSPSKGHHHYRHVSAKAPRTYIRGLGHGGGIAYARRAHWAPRGQGRGFVNLVGDPGSGLGFYALPLKYRIGAWRYRLTHRRPWWDNPVLFAIAADAARYNYWIPANRGYAYGVFNPYDGVGTPFFGGYYSSSRDDDTPSDLDAWP